MSPERRQQTIRAFARDDSFHHIHGQRLDIHNVCNILVGHDGRRIGVDEDGGDALLAERLARLRAGVVKLRRLPDDDRAGADDEDFGGLWGGIQR